METQDKLSLSVGNEDFKIEKLNPARVKILGVSVEPKSIKGKNSDIVIVSVKHPEREEQLAISKIKFIKENQLKVVGLWINQDSSGNIQKGTSVAEFLAFCKVKTLKELIGKEADTVSDEKGYLVLKAYS